jgi:outer membrane protein TolC
MLRNTLRALVVAAVWFPLQAARADDPARNPSLNFTEPRQAMTLAQALDFARAHHPRLKVADAEVRFARELAEEPKARWLPSFGVTAQVVGSSNNNSATNWLGSKGAVEFPRIAGTGFLQHPSDIDWKPYLNTSVGVSGEQLVFDSGRIAAELAVADALTDAQQASKEDRQLSVELGVRETYFATLAARAVVEVARQAERRASVHRDEAHARVTQGVRSRVEELRAEADLARFQVGVLRAEAGLRSAQAAFAEAVGAPSPLGAVDEPGVAAPTTVPTLEVVLDDAARRDPVVREALLRERAAQAEVRLATTELLPEVYVVATVSSAAGGAPKEGTTSQTWGLGAVPWVPDYFAGAVLSWRFFDPVRRARQTSAERAGEITVAELENVQQQSIARVQQAWVRAQVAAQSLPALENARLAAQANYEQAEVRVNSGLGTAVELADAEALRTSAEVELVLGRFEVVRARASLVRVAGGEW